jgi:hypothetical protein
LLRAVRPPGAEEVDSQLFESVSRIVAPRMTFCGGEIRVFLVEAAADVGADVEG